MAIQRCDVTCRTHRIAKVEDMPKEDGFEWNGDWTVDKSVIPAPLLRLPYHHSNTLDRAVYEVRR